MYILRYISVLMFLCASGFGLDAQKTHLWQSAGGPNNSLRSPSFYEMYKFDIQTGERELLFRIDSIRFVHPNMTGNSFKIVSFAYSTDRKTIYFLEFEGDLYKYDVGADDLQYIKDLSPGNVNFLWHGYNQTLQIDQLNDSLYYIGGAIKGILNVRNFEFTVIRAVPNQAAASTDLERRMFMRKLEKHKDQYLMFDAYVHLVEANLYDPEQNITLHEIDNSLNYFDDTNLISYQYGCDSTALFILQTMYDAEGRDAIQIDRMDLNTGQITRWKNYIGLANDNVITRKIRDAQHFNEPVWGACQRYIDLDKDDSTAPGLDYLIEGICGYDAIPLSDIDVQISNEYPIDSIEIEVIEDNDTSVEIKLPTGDYVQKSMPNHGQMLINSGTTSHAEFARAIREGYVDMSEDPKEGEVKIGIRVWYNGESGNTAIASIILPGPPPSAGKDSLFQFCNEYPMPVLSELKSSGADENGQYYDEDFRPLTEIPSWASSEIVSMYYIVSNGVCEDTARYEIKIHAVPMIEGVEDMVLCAEEERTVRIRTNGESIEWSDGITSTERDIQISGTYQYELVNEYGCVARDTFEVRKLPPAYEESVDVKLCKDSVYHYATTPIQESGVYKDTIVNELGCDSIIRVLRIEKVREKPIEITGDTSFCKGGETILTVASDHVEIVWNEEEPQRKYKVNGPGKITVRAKDEHGCPWRRDIEIIEYPLPELYTMDMLDTIYRTGLTLSVSYDAPYERYEWSPSEQLSCGDCPYPMLLAAAGGEYTVTVTDEYGCTNRSEILISFKESVWSLPNIISKNPELGINGVFFMKGQSSQSYALYVYDRWGNVIFKNEGGTTDDELSGWRPKSDIKSGVYVYVIKYEEQGIPKIIRGDITLIE